MSPHDIEYAIAQDKNGPRLLTLYRYLRNNRGPKPRDTIMKWTGFPAPADQPVCAYVSFANAIMRLDQVLRGRGKSICRRDEMYWLSDKVQTEEAMPC